MFNKKLLMVGILWVAFIVGDYTSNNNDKALSILPIVSRINEIRAGILAQEPNEQEAYQRILTNREIYEFMSRPEYRAMLAGGDTLDYFSDTPVSIENLVEIFRNPELQGVIEYLIFNADFAPIFAAPAQEQQQIHLPSFGELTAGIPADQMLANQTHLQPDDFQEIIHQLESGNASQASSSCELLSSGQKRLRKESDSEDEEERSSKKVRLSQDDFLEWALSSEAKDDSDDEGPSRKKMRL